MAKTIIACRPGMQQTMQAQFAGMEVIVDQSLATDYEFRERELSFEEILEEEIEKEERQEADPKNATTFIVPVVKHFDDIADNWSNNSYLVVRIERGPAMHEVRKVVTALQPTLTGGVLDGEVNVSATMGALKAALKKGGFNVLSISEAEGMEVMEDA